MSARKTIGDSILAASGGPAAALRLFQSFKTGLVTFTCVEGAAPGTFDAVIHQANPQFAEAVGRRGSNLSGLRLVRDFGETFAPLIAASRVAAELDDVVKTSLEIAADGQNLIFDARCRATDRLYCAALFDVTDFVLANRNQERRIGELLFVNDALESQASELARLAEEIEASRQTLDIEVARRTKLEEELRRMADFDELTGIANRRAFLADAQFALDSRALDEDCAFVLLDIDHFKSINDTFGHVVGDDVLRRVTALIAAEIDAVNTLFGRIGGEEFALLMPRTGLAEAAAVAETIRGRIADTAFRSYNAPLDLTVSLGVTVSRPGETNLTALVGRADVALYAAKAAGRNTVQVAPPEPSEPL